MLRYKLRTLLILLAVLPPLLWVGWGKYQAWRAEQERQKAAAAASARQTRLGGTFGFGGGTAPAGTSAPAVARPRPIASADEGPPGFGPLISEPRRR